MVDRLVGDRVCLVERRSLAPTPSDRARASTGLAQGPDRWAAHRRQSRRCLAGGGGHASDAPGARAPDTRARPASARPDRPDLRTCCDGSIACSGIGGHVGSRVFRPGAQVLARCRGRCHGLVRTPAQEPFRHRWHCPPDDRLRDHVQVDRLGRIALPCREVGPDRDGGGGTGGRGLVARLAQPALGSDGPRRRRSAGLPGRLCRDADLHNHERSDRAGAHGAGVAGARGPRPGRGFQAVGGGGLSWCVCHTPAGAPGQRRVVVQPGLWAGDHGVCAVGQRAGALAGDRGACSLVCSWVGRFHTPRGARPAAAFDAAGLAARVCRAVSAVGAGLGASSLGQRIARRRTPGAGVT